MGYCLRRVGCRQACVASVSIISVFLQVSRVGAVEQSASAISPFLVPLRRESVPVRRQGKVVSHRTSYSGILNIGYPAQEFRVVFDTGSGHVILPAAECFSDACLAHRRYNMTKSLTALPINADGSIVEPGDLCDQVTIGFGTGEVTGEFVRERVCLGKDNGDSSDSSAPCANLHVITAVEMSTQPFKSFAFDGILGLGLKGLALSSNFSFFESASWGHDQRAPHQFAAFLTEGGDDEEASEIAFGGYNPARTLEALSWAPAVFPEFGHWQVEIRTIRVGGAELDICKDGTCRGVVDTGTSHLGVPAPFDKELATLLERPAGGASDCHRLEAPEVEIEIPGRTLTLYPENYMRRMPLGENVSVSSTTVGLHPRQDRGAQPSSRLRSSSKATAEEADRPEKFFCRPKLMPVDLPAPLGPKLFILGEPLLHRYYTVFDWELLQLGFGLAATRRNTAALQRQLTV